MRLVYALGGEKQEKYTDVDSCLSFCANSARCVAVDYKPSKMECFVHWSSKDTDPQNLFNSDDKDFYTINRTCLTEGETFTLYLCMIMCTPTPRE